MLAAVLEFQRDMISENTREGVAAAAVGKTLGRPAAFDAGKLVEIVEAYSEGATVKGLARQYGVDPKTLRRVLDSAGAREVPDELDKELIEEAPTTTKSRHLPIPRLPSTPPASLPSICATTRTRKSAKRCATAGPSAADRATPCASPRL